MESTDFYVTLPSNANMSEYPSNRPSKFKVDLSHRRELNDGVWEMALTEIQFTNNWRYCTPGFDLLVWFGDYYPISFRHKHRHYFLDKVSDAENILLDEVANLNVTTLLTEYVTVPAGEWRDEYEFGNMLALCLMNGINKRIVRHHVNRITHPVLESLRYERDKTSKRGKFVANDGKVPLFITTEHTKVMSMLGLTLAKYSSQLEAAGKKIRVYTFGEDSAVTQPIMGFPALEVMFVYSSVCEEQHIGDHAGNLLRTVAVTVERGKRQCERYSPPTYVRLRPSTLNSIDIQLSDKTGAEVSFGDLSSLVVLQLHVRKR